ncbi:ABC transporter permease [Streptomyces sp. A3M-1-3]|uniref:ABC transporter permease n=1 Tax=Streptomyces sp. A3M-1-3 TaxID=2962044 RepID=UPI0020B6EC77|nr:ABC transporter permease [Streptomyces sp. A3M-1-3]MCP3818177.1 ABC transporter permease [Streptomyces sp. A3M-1-3]
MTTAEAETGPAKPALSPAAIARARRRAAAARFWRDFRSHRAGLGGLVLLGVFVLLALFAPLLADRDSLDITRVTAPSHLAPSLHYPLGTDENGRSILTLLLYGTRVSLTVGLAATAISMAIGTLVGIMAGFYGGWARSLLMGVTDWFLVLPFLPLAIVLATLLGASLTNIIVVIGITSWPGTARLVCAQTLTIRARPYLERARALGAGGRHQMTRHVLPNAMPLVIANTVLTVSIAILSETTLSFLGLGDPTQVSWGSILDHANESGAMSRGEWWFVLPPGICVILVVLSFTLIGRTLETVLNPRLREGGRR